MTSSRPIPRAATVLLLRNGSDDRAPEVFTITRSQALAFSAGVSAFPGGRIDTSDALDPALWAGTDLGYWGRQLRLGPDAAGLVLAGVVRETFEETGILLARQLDGTAVDPGLLTSLPTDTRERVERHDLDFGLLLSDHGLQPDVTRLRALARWITPTGQSRRYDTYFFAAAMPRGQQPGLLSFEGFASRWTTANEAMADFRAGRHQLLPPTWAAFRALLPAHSVEQALSSHGDLAPVRPYVLALDRSTSVAGFAQSAAYAADLRSFRQESDVGPVDDLDGNAPANR